MAMRVVISEQTSLQHSVGAGFDSRHQVRWRVSGLLDLREIVFRVLVQRHASNRDEREFLLRPDLGHVEWIVLEGLRLLESHYLDRQVPRRIFAFSNGVVQVADRIVRIGACELVGFVDWQVLDALCGLEMKLDVVRFAARVDQLVGVRAVTVAERN